MEININLRGNDRDKRLEDGLSAKKFLGKKFTGTKKQAKEGIEAYKKTLGAMGVPFNHDTYVAFMMGLCNGHSLTEKEHDMSHDVMIPISKYLAEQED